MLSPVIGLPLYLAFRPLSYRWERGYWREALWDGTEGPSVLGDAVYIPICYAKHVYIIRDGIDLGGDIVLPHDHGIAIMENITKWDYKK